MRRVRICEAGSQELLSKLLKGEIDVAMLGSVAPLDEEKVYVQLLTKRPYSIMVSAKSPLAQRKRSVLRNWPISISLPMTSNTFMWPQCVPTLPMRISSQL